jgi:hypothetical protein
MLVNPFDNPPFVTYRSVGLWSNAACHAPEMSGGGLDGGPGLRGRKEK